MRTQLALKMKEIQAASQESRDFSPAAAGSAFCQRPEECGADSLPGPSSKSPGQPIL